MQLGLTATPKRDNRHADTYGYFGEPVYVYTLKEGINDGFLTPIQGVTPLIGTTLDEYRYTEGDGVVVQGEPEPWTSFIKKADFQQEPSTITGP